MPRTFNCNIGDKILDIIYRHEPLGIWYRQLQREGNLNFKTLTGWLKHLRSHDIIYTSKRFIRFTYEKLEEYQSGDLVVPGVKFNERKRLLPGSRECQGLLHV